MTVLTGWILVPCAPGAHTYTILFRLVHGSLQCASLGSAVLHSSVLLLEFP